MTLSLENFKVEPEKTLSLSDFSGAVPSGLSIGVKAASQIAATRSLLVHTNEDEFRQTRQMLLDPATRGNYAVEQTALREKLFQEAVGNLTSLASDPNVPLDDRITMVQGANEGFKNPFSRTPNLDLLSEESLVADSGPQETDLASEQRMGIFDQFRQVNERKRRIATAINGLNMGENSVAENIVDVAELMAPLAEWLHIDRLLSDAEENFVGGDSGVFQLLGTQKEKLYEMIKAIPSEEREEFSIAIIDLVKDHENVLFPDGNDMMAVDTLERMLLDGNYSDFEYWFDQITSVLDMTFVGGLAVRGISGSAEGAARGARASRGAARGSSQVFEGEIVSGGTDVALRDVFDRPQVQDVFDLDASQWSEIGDVPRIARSESTRTEVPPTAPSQVVKDTNPQMARDMHEAMMADETGEAAEALYGASRTEAAAKDILPEPGIRDGVNPNKVEMPRQPVNSEPNNIRENRLRNANTILNEGELQRVVTNFSDRLKLQANNVVVRMNPDATMKVTARYNPPNEAFKTYDDAVAQAEYAFRNYGLSEEDFTVMYREGDSWKPLSREESTNLPQNTSYSVAVDFDYRIRPEDLTEVDLLTTGNFMTRLIDRVPATLASPARLGQGSFVQNLLDAASVIHPQVVNSAAVAVDKTVRMRKLYSELMNDFSEAYQAATKERRLALTNYINEANFNGIAFNITDLRSRGFSSKEIEALKRWRRANDAMWHATNEDLVKTLRNRGVKALTHKDSNTLLYGRPVSKGSVGRREVGFDPQTGRNVNLTSETLDDLYENGGELIKLDEPIEVDGDWVDYGISRNTPQGGFTREIRDNEAVLSYRDGYYPVMYDANYFITKTIQGPGGRTINKVVGTAKTREEAETAVKNLGSEYDFRKDRRFTQRQAAMEIGEEGWNASVNSGLSAQRVRGQKLKDYGVDPHMAGNTNLKDPLEAVTQQIASISQRIPMRDFFDMAKSRWMLNYGKHLDLPVNPKTGQKEFPTSVAQITGGKNLKANFVADARTNFNYLNGLENGYINGIDEAYRGTMHALAELAADMKLPSLEKLALQSTALSPVQSAKSTAFNLFLSLNPVRQAIVQRTQIAMLGAINPKYFSNGLSKDMWNLNLQRAGIDVSDEYASLLKELEESGILDAVDAHNFVRQDMVRLADLTAMQRAGTLSMRPVEMLRKVGFDLAEQDNLLAAWLTHRNMAKEAGKDLNDLRVKEQILGDTRAFTLHMNRAGDQPYSQNTFGVAAQFLSFPHKFLLQGVTNKNYTPMQKAQLLAYTTAVFGVGATAMVPIYDYVFEGSPDSAAREIIEEGLLHKMLNEVATLASGEEQAVDWGDLAPTEAYGMGNVIVGMLNTDLSAMITESPAGSLLFGANPRINNLFTSAMRLFNVHDDYEDPELNTTLPDVIKAFLNLSSGYSNVFKAAYALEARQKLSGTGTVTDSDVTAFEAWMAAAGFQTETESGYRETREVIYGDSDYLADDVRNWYNTVKGQITRRGMSPTEQDMAIRIASEAWRVFGQDRPKAAQEVTRMLQRDAADGDYRMFQAIMRLSGYRSSEEMDEIVSALPEGIVKDRAREVLGTRLGEE